MIKLEKCVVTQAKTPVKEGFYSLQVGAGIIHPKRVVKPIIGHCLKAGVEPKRRFMEFRVSPEAMLPVGTPLSVRHFSPGQYVVLKGHTKGKGFQGGMKKHGFHGLPASHGVSLTHRSIGSTGNRKSPGRVFKGKKMPGKMGGLTQPQRSVTLMVYKIDVKNDVLYVNGAVPGGKDSWLRIVDCNRKEHLKPPPFPTFTPVKDAEELDEIVADLPKPDISGEDIALEEILQYFETGKFNEENILTPEFIAAERAKTEKEERDIIESHIITVNPETHAYNLRRLSTEHLVEMGRSDLYDTPPLGSQMQAVEDMSEYFSHESEHDRRRVLEHREKSRKLTEAEDLRRQQTAEKEKNKPKKSKRYNDRSWNQ